MHDVDLPPSPKQSEWIWFLQSVGQQQALAASAHKNNHMLLISVGPITFLSKQCGVFALL